VFEIAARESGIPINDILENLPHELSVWVDPGEVSYRIGEKGSVQVCVSDLLSHIWRENIRKQCFFCSKVQKEYTTRFFPSPQILYSESHDAAEDMFMDKEVTKTFKPESQCFRPIEAVAVSLNNLSIAPKTTHPASTSSSPMFKNNMIVTPPNGFMNRSSEPIKFTTASFAQTKFGSTKLKNNVKKSNRYVFAIGRCHVFVLKYYMCHSISFICPLELFLNIEL
jgi:protein Tob/BTG